jgi:hypothetical protein
MSVRPIFVIGRHRSGTTWLSNVVASLPGVYAPMHEAHGGIHESAFFSHLVPYCNGGRTAADLLAIKYLFERSDYFLLTGLDEGPDIVRHGYTGYFRQVMDAASQRVGARFWLEKTPAHTLFARFLSESFPDAILLAMVRNARDVVASNVHGFGNPRSVWGWLRQAFVTGVYERIIARSRAHVIRYEDLRDDFRGTVRSITEQLGLPGDVGIVESAFDRNTSYNGHAPPISWWQIAAIGLGRGVARVCPGALIEIAAGRWNAQYARALPPWFFLLGAKSGSG